MSELNNEPNIEPAADADSPDTDSVNSESTDGETAGDLTVDQLRDWLREWVSQATGLPVEQIAVDRPMEELGLSSRDAVALAADVEDKTGVILTATVVYNHPTIATLAQRIIEGDPDEGADGDADTFWRRERTADDDAERHPRRQDPRAVRRPGCAAG